MDEPIRGKVSFDLDAFARRLERQQVIEFSDVDMLIEVVCGQHAELVAARTFIAAADLAGVDGLCTPEDAQRWLAALMEYKRAIGER